MRCVELNAFGHELRTTNYVFELQVFIIYYTRRCCCVLLLTLSYPVAVSHPLLFQFRHFWFRLCFYNLRHATFSKTARRDDAVCNFLFGISCVLNFNTNYTTIAIDQFSWFIWTSRFNNWEQFVIVVHDANEWMQMLLVRMNVVGRAVAVSCFWMQLV